MSNLPARDLRTPIARARGLGSGKTGTEHFWIQRVTAVALALLVPWLIGLLVSMVGADLDSVRAAIARPWNAIFLSVFAVALFWHAKLGIQVVIEDYVHTRGTEITLHLANTFLCAVGALASLYAIGRIALLG
ncbi:succinate dehydrogenase, hydrophobic membrane anchor protein [Lysobacter sp. CFH 32150]|uniref:succinate dehydrogenase, hydrophobic membrane anchor protein n=1 Tax=Lysobacter sp. CFH 32150 TaxID=2927128 RepID=UPI001FA6FA01|nr:succinate dehydrogenase, hydrophobic membrane anchor protein [Lysobacter sp. CFH 32150]MCI4566491.1 succinate dehydrogenase, hydrophobic membrane anchor protein [Lysobacter sp. CFH 32150]